MSAVADPGQRERGQTLRQRAEHRHAGARRQIEHADDDGRADDGDQDARHALAALEQQDHRQGALRRPANAVQFALPASTACGDRPHVRAAARSASIEKPNSLGSWLISTVSAMPFM